MHDSRRCIFGTDLGVVNAARESMRRVLAVLLVLLPTAALAQSADLPNADLPGNAPTLPNSNLPGSLPTSNPISLPSTDTSKAVTPWEPTLFPPYSSVPKRNPTAPVPVEDRAVDQRALLEQALENARGEAAAAREDAAQARDEAAAARDEAAHAQSDAADLREQLAREHEENTNAPRANPPARAPALK